MPTDERPQLHLNYTCNFPKMTRLCGYRLVRYSVDAAGTEEGHLICTGTVSDRTDIRTAWLPSNFLVSVACVHKSHTITDLNVQPGVDLSVPPGGQRPRHIIQQQQELAIHHCPTNIHSTTLLKNNGVETKSRRNNQPLIEVRDTPLWNPSVFSLCTANELVSST